MTAAAVGAFMAHLQEVIVTRYSPYITRETPRIAMVRPSEWLDADVPADNLSSLLKYAVTTHVPLCDAGSLDSPGPWALAVLNTRTRVVQYHHCAARGETPCRVDASFMDARSQATMGVAFSDSADAGVTIIHARPENSGVVVCKLADCLWQGEETPTAMGLLELSQYRRNIAHAVAVGVTRARPHAPA